MVMLIGANGPVAYVPPTPAPPHAPTAHEVGLAQRALQGPLGNHAPDDDAAVLKAAVQQAQVAEAALRVAALARAAIAMQARYDAAHHTARDPHVDAITEAQSEIALTGAFAPATLALAAHALMDGPLASDASAKGGMAAAQGAIQQGLSGGLTWQEAVNLASLGGGTPNEVVPNEVALDEAALAIRGDQLEGTGDALARAAQQLAGLHIFTKQVQQAALQALTITVKPSAGLSAAAHEAEHAYGAWQKDQAAHASAAQLAQDGQTYHQALSIEFNAAAGETGSNWRDDLQIDRCWQAELTVLATNTAPGVPSAPSAAQLHTELQATAIIDAAQAARGSGGAADDLQAARTLTQALQGVASSSALSAQVLGDPRMQALQAAALQAILNAHGSNAQRTLIAQGQALSRYRGTVLYPRLLSATLGSAVTRRNVAQAGTPGNLAAIASLLTSVAQASPELAAALGWQPLTRKIVSLIQHDDPNAAISGTPQQMDDYYGPLGNIITALGGPGSVAARPVMQALKSRLSAQQALVDLEKRHDQFDPALSPFLRLVDAKLDGSSLSAYQALIDEDPGSALARTLAQYTGLKPAPAPIRPAPQDAAQLSKAQSALNKVLGTARVNARTLGQALATARKDDPAITGLTWAQAALLVKAAADGQQWEQVHAAELRAGTATPPKDLIAQAEGELTQYALFDADTLDAATRALQQGAVPAANAPPSAQALQAGGPGALGYMSSLLQEGMTVREALVTTRAWLGGSSATEYLLAQTALTVEGQQNLPQYDANPRSVDPIRRASQQLAAMDVLDAGALKRATSAMVQDPTPDMKALQGAIARAQHNYRAWQQAQASLAKAPGNAKRQQSMANALQRYHNALTAALDAAAGRRPGDSGWQTDPDVIDTLWKAQNTLELTALAPNIEAAQGTGSDSPQSQQLQGALTQWQSSLDAQQVIAQTLYAQQQSGGAGAGDVAAAQQLSSQLGGMVPGDAVYDQVMGDATIGGLKTAILQSMSGAAAPPPGHAVNGDDSPQARLSAEGRRLAAYASTVFYAQLLDGTVSAAPTRDLFAQIGAQVRGAGNAQDKGNALADALQGTSPDLAAALYHAQFAGTGQRDVVVQWARQANDLSFVLRIYAAAGGASNPDMTALRHDVEAMLATPLSDGGFGRYSVGSSLDSRLVSHGKFTESSEGQDFGLGELKSRGVPMQLVQDIIGDEPGSPVGQELERETGFSDSGKPAVALGAKGNASLQLQADSPWQPGEMAVTAGHHLAGLPWQDGMQVVTSYDAVLTEVAQAEGLQPQAVPEDLASEQALADNQFALYNRDEVVYDHGRRTTLGEIADQLIKGEGGEPPSALAPVALASLSLQWYANQDGTGTAQQLAVMEGLDAQGRYIDVGPANTSVRAGLWAWQSHTGLDGLAIVQPHWVLDGNGALLTGNAYWTRFRPDDHWYDWANLKADLEIAGTAVAGALMSFVQPETAALWLVALSDLADAWFAVSAAIGTVQSVGALWTQGGGRYDQNWLSLAANLFGGLAGVGGVAERSAMLATRIAVSDEAFANALKLANAANNGARAVREFQHTLPELLLRRVLVGTPEAVERTVRLVTAVSRATGTLAYRGIGVAAMASNVVSMGFQAEQMLTMKGGASPLGWAQLLSSAGLMGLGLVASRGHDGAQRRGPDSQGVSEEGADQGAKGGTGSTGMQPEGSQDTLEQTLVTRAGSGRDGSYGAPGDDTTESPAKARKAATSVPHTPQTQHQQPRSQAQLPLLSRSQTHEVFGKTAAAASSDVGGPPEAEKCVRQACDGEIDEEGFCDVCGFAPPPPLSALLGGGGLWPATVALLPPLEHPLSGMVREVYHTVTGLIGQYLPESAPPVEFLEKITHIVPTDPRKPDTKGRYFPEEKGGPRILVSADAARQKASGLIGDNAEPFVSTLTARSIVAHEGMHALIAPAFRDRGFQLRDEMIAAGLPPMNLEEGWVELLAWRFFGKRPDERTHRLIAAAFREHAKMSPEEPTAYEDSYSDGDDVDPVAPLSLSDYLHGSASSALPVSEGLPNSPVEGAYFEHVAAVEFLVKLVGRKTMYAAAFGGDPQALDRVFTVARGPVAHFAVKYLKLWQDPYLAEKAALQIDWPNGSGATETDGADGQPRSAGAYYWKNDPYARWVAREQVIPLTFRAAPLPDVPLSPSFEVPRIESLGEALPRAVSTDKRSPPDSTAAIAAVPIVGDWIKRGGLAALGTDEVPPPNAGAEKTPAANSTGEQDVAERLTRLADGKHVLVFSGYSGLEYAEPDKLVAFIDSILTDRIEEYGAENLLVVAGATEDGIGIVYQRAKLLGLQEGLQTAGIVSELGKAYASAYCDDVVPISDPQETWQVLAADGSSYMVAIASEYIVLGGGEVALAEAKEALERGDIRVTIEPSFKPNGDKVAARQAKEPAFNPEHVLKQLEALAKQLKVLELQARDSRSASTEADPTPPNDAALTQPGKPVDESVARIRPKVSLGQLAVAEPTGRLAADTLFGLPYQSREPGQFMIIERRRSVDVRLYVGDPQAEGGVQDVITMTEFYRGELPGGSGSRLVVDLLRHYGMSLLAGGKLVFDGISNQSVLDAFVKATFPEAGTGGVVGEEAARPETTLLGRSGAAIIKGMGLEVAKTDWWMDMRTGRVYMSFLTRAEADAPKSSSLAD